MRTQDSTGLGAKAAKGRERGLVGGRAGLYTTPFEEGAGLRNSLRVIHSPSRLRRPTSLDGLVDVRDTPILRTVMMVERDNEPDDRSRHLCPDATARACA